MYMPLMEDAPRLRRHGDAEPALAEPGPAATPSAAAEAAAGRRPARARPRSATSIRYEVRDARARHDGRPLDLRRSSTRTCCRRPSATSRPPTPPTPPARATPSAWWTRFAATWTCASIASAPWSTWPTPPPIWPAPPARRRAAHEPTRAERPAPEPPAGRAHAWPIVRWVLVALMAVVAAGSLLSHVPARAAAPASAARRPVYYCPMHPQIVQDHPGECPICSMTLVPRPTGATRRAAGHHGPTGGRRRRRPGLVPVGHPPGARPEDRHPHRAGHPPGAGRRPAHAPASSQADERGLASISPRFSGWIETAGGGRDRPAGQARPGAGHHLQPRGAAGAAGAADRAAAGRDTGGRRPRHHGTPARWRGWWATPAAGWSCWASRPRRSRPSCASAQAAAGDRHPLAGRRARDRQERGRGHERVARACRCSRWPTCRRSGWWPRCTSRTCSASGWASRRASRAGAYPGETFTGQGEVRLPDAGRPDRAPCACGSSSATGPGRRGLKLRPGMYGDVLLDLPATTGLMVPAEAVVDTGDVQYVFVARDGGRFEPRRVQRRRARRATGSRSLEGLAEGETVVTTANFLIDSESRLRAAIEGQRAPPPGALRTRPWSSRSSSSAPATGCWCSSGSASRCWARSPPSGAIKLDAIPDLSDPQVIVFTEWMGRSPTLVEDQVTYPIVSSADRHARSVTDVRGYSMFGMSFIYVIFEEGTDVYWARSRVLEYLSGLRGRLPEGVEPRARARRHRHRLGVPVRARGQDAASTASTSCAPSRTSPCATRWAACPGVAEVASVGGYQKQYQVTVDPEQAARLRRHARRTSSAPSAPRTTTWAAASSRCPGASTTSAGAATSRTSASIEKIALRATGPGGHAAAGAGRGQVRFGPDIRRGAARVERRGRGGRRASWSCATARTRSRSSSGSRRSSPSCGPASPQGVELEIAYDRSGLIERSIDTLKTRADRGGDRRQPGDHPVPAAPAQLAAAHPVAAHRAWRSSFIPMYLLDIPSTIMSLGGIAIAIGATVDAEIVMIEAVAQEARARAGPGADRHKLLAEAAREVTPGHLLLAADHRGGVPAGLHADRPGRAPVQAARLHQDLRHADLGAPLDHLRARRCATS